MTSASACRCELGADRLHLPYTTVQPNRPPSDRSRRCRRHGGGGGGWVGGGGLWSLGCVFGGILVYFWVVFFLVLGEILTYVYDDSTGSSPPMTTPHGHRLHLQTLTAWNGEPNVSARPPTTTYNNANHSPRWPPPPSYDGNGNMTTIRSKFHHGYTTRPRPAATPHQAAAPPLHLRRPGSTDAPPPASRPTPHPAGSVGPKPPARFTHHIRYSSQTVGWWPWHLS